MAYTIVSVLPFAALFHLHAMGHVSDRAFRYGLPAALALLLLATALGIALPLRGGRRALQRHEF